MKTWHAVTGLAGLAGWLVGWLGWLAGHIYHRFFK